MKVVFGVSSSKFLLNAIMWHHLKLSTLSTKFPLCSTTREAAAIPWTLRRMGASRKNPIPRKLAICQMDGGVILTIVSKLFDLVLH